MYQSPYAGIFPIGLAVDSQGSAYVAALRPVLLNSGSPNYLPYFLPNPRIVKVAPQGDGAPNRFFMYDPHYFVEGTSSGVDVFVGRTGDLSASASVGYATADETAIAGEDYVSTQGSLSFAAGEGAKTLRVRLIAVPASLISGDWIFDFSLDPSRSLSGADTSLVTICNAKAPPPILIPVSASPGTTWTATTSGPFLNTGASGTGSGGFSLYPSSDVSQLSPGVYSYTIVWYVNGNQFGQTTVILDLSSYP